VGTTQRREPDKAVVLSGVFEGKTLGTPIAVIIENINQRSLDYKSDIFRPGHGDKTTLYKYGVRDYRGGGRASGRETVARVIAGYFAGLIIPSVVVRSMIAKLGPFEGDLKAFERVSTNPYERSFGEDAKQVENFLMDLKERGDSIGGKVCIKVNGCPRGLGEPVFDKLKADLSKAILSIGGVVAFSFGLGEEISLHYGSSISLDSGNFGGIEGGISNGEEIVLSCVFKPTSTVGKMARAGRHDPCIILRALPVVESMVKVVLADHYLRQKAYEL
jgi:chorismate synthase